MQCTVFMYKLRRGFIHFRDMSRQAAPLLHTHVTQLLNLGCSWKLLCDNNGIFSFSISMECLQRGAKVTWAPPGDSECCKFEEPLILSTFLHDNDGATYKVDPCHSVVTHLALQARFGSLMFHCCVIPTTCTLFLLLLPNCIVSDWTW